MWNVVTLTRRNFMVNEIFLGTLTVIFAVLLWWGFKTLPGESWQIIASLPVSRDESGVWKGVNLTYYGLLTASTCIIAIALLFILMGAIGIPLTGTLAMVIILLLNCIPASRLMARIIEKKSHTRFWRWFRLSIHSASYLLRRLHQLCGLMLLLVCYRSGILCFSAFFLYYGWLSSCIPVAARLPDQPSPFTSTGGEFKNLFCFLSDAGFHVTCLRASHRQISKLHKYDNLRYLCEPSKR